MAKKNTLERTMLDKLGREMHVGDAVVFRHKRWKILQTGRISRFTPKQAEITWSDSRNVFKVFAGKDDIILIPEEDYVMYALTTV